MASLLFLPGKVFASIVGIYYFRYLPRPYRLVLLLIAIALFCESYGYYISIYRHAHNAWVFNIYMFFEALLLGVAAIYLTNNQFSKKSFLVLLILNSIIWIAVIVTNSIYAFATISMVCGCCVLTVIYIVVLYTNSLFSNEKAFKQPVFWLSIATILYFGCDIPYMGFQSYLIAHSPILVLKLENINRILDRIRYPLVAISFILLGRQKQVGFTAA